MSAMRRRPDSLKPDHDNTTQSTGGIREDFVAASVLAVLTVVGLFLIGALAWTSRAFAEMSVGSGEVSINGGEVYAGDGCVRAGNVVAGDCEDGGGGDGGGVKENPATMPETTVPETTLEESEATTGMTQENTALEVTSSQESTNGEITFEPEGTVPESIEDAACPTEPTGTTHETTVKRATDGDTLQISDEIEGTDRVRLISVDSPEMDVEGEQGPETGAEEATRFSADALEGEDVVLELDEESKDDYGRLLAYVWINASGGAQDDQTSEAARTESKKRGSLSDLRRMDGTDSESGDESGAELFNATLLEAGHAKVLTVEPNDAYAGCFGAIEEQTGQGGTTEEQYAPSDEQYTVERTTVEEITPEQTAPEASEQTTIQEATSKAPETPMESTEPVEPVGPIEETTAEEVKQPAMEETTAAPEESAPTTEPVTQAPPDQYSEQTAMETTVPAETNTSEEFYGAPESELPEETTSAPRRDITQPEAAPSASIPLDPSSGTEAEPMSGEETPVAEPVTASPVDTYTPSAAATQTGSLPTVETSEGPITVLPDTGGSPVPELLAGVMGVASVAVGAAGLVLVVLSRLSRARRLRGGAPERR